MERRENYLQLSAQELLKIYELENIEMGLNAKQVQVNRRAFGENKLEVKRTSKWQLLIRQFHNTIIYSLLFAMSVTLCLGHVSDATIIAFVIIVNALIGYYQEVSASNALDRMKELLSVEATVYRERIRKDIPAKELVVGDVVFLEAGDQVPADLRMIEADNLRIQESILTGEADSVGKTSDALVAEHIPLAEHVNVAFASTSVTAGSGIGIVIATGKETELGKVSLEVDQAAARKTPLMKEIDHLGKGLTYLIMGIGIALFSISFFSQNYPLPVVTLAVITMIVGSIPEGLPATTTVVLAMGVSDMAQHKHTLIKTLPAVETLGSVEVIATDKTGTLTKNEMTIKDIVLEQAHYQVTGDGYQPNGEILDSQQLVVKNQQLTLLLEAGFEANDTVLVPASEGWQINGEPTDGSFLTLYYKYFSYPIQPKYEEVDFLPFDSDYRYMAKLVQDTRGEKMLFVKGSPDKLFAMAKRINPTSFNEEYWQKQVMKLSIEGKRVVAVGYQKVASDQMQLTHELLQKGIQLVGVVGIIDPPREEVIRVLSEMNQAGVQVKMITGDHPLTAKAIGQRLNLAPMIQVVTGLELDEMDEKEFQQAVLSNQIFARTTPKNKVEIIKSLQASNKVTAMIGDGVNDAPALKQADIGVSMGLKGTDIAKDAADMILTDDNFGTMSLAIKEGRRIYDAIKKSILFLLPTSFAEGFIIVFTIMMQKDMPLQPTQLLWINMVSAMTIQFAFIFEPAEANSMNRKPRKTGNRLLTKQDIAQILLVSLVMAIMSIASYEWLLTTGVTQAVASTMMINSVVFSKIFYLFTIRTTDNLCMANFFKNPQAFVIIGFMIILQLILTYVPFMQVIFYTANMSGIAWLLAITSGLVILVMAELVKWIRLKKYIDTE